MNEEKINFKNNYKGLLLDIEGVIYESNKLIEGSIETINKLLANGFKIKYLTNTTTTSRRLIFEKLLQFKLPLNESDIFSPAYLFWTGLLYYFSGSGFCFSSVKDPQA